MEKLKNGDYVITAIGDPEKQKLIWEKLQYVTIQQFQTLGMYVNRNVIKYKEIKNNFHFTLFMFGWFIGTFIAGIYRIIPNIFNNSIVQIFMNSIFYGFVIYIAVRLIKKLYFYRINVKMKDKIKELKETGKDQEILNKFLDILSKYELTANGNKEFFDFLRTIKEKDELIQRSMNAVTQMFFISMFNFNHEDGGIGQETYEKYQENKKYLEKNTPEEYWKLFCEAEEELKKVIEVYEPGSEQYKRIFEIMSENVSIKSWIIVRLDEGVLTDDILEEADTYLVLNEGVDPNTIKNGVTYQFYVDNCKFVPNSELTEDMYVLHFNKKNKTVEE